MKNKLITGVLLVALTSMGFGTLTSCKDNEDDLRNELTAEQVNLKAALEELQKQCQQCKTDCAAKLSDLENRLANYQQNGNLTHDELYSLINELTRTKADKTSVENILILLNGTDGYKGLLERVDALEQLQHYTFTDEELAGITFLGQNKDALEQLLVLNDYINDIKSIAALKTELENLTKEGGVLDGIKSELAGVKGDITSINNTITNINNSITTINNNIESLNTALYGADGQSGLISKVDKLVTDYGTLNGKVEGLETKVEGLEQWFDGINMTVAQFQENVRQGEFVKTNKSALEYLIGLKDKLKGDALDALNSVYQDLEGIDDMYTAIFKDAQLPEGETKWWNYGEVMQKIKDNSAAISALEEKVDVLFQRFNDMVTSLLLQASLNPVYGSFNTPFGLNSMVLVACYGDRATNLGTFPSSGVGAECYDSDNDDIDWSTIAQDTYNVASSQYIVNTLENGNANLGSFWFTVNPGTVNKVDLSGFALVNSREDEPVVELSDIYKDDETTFKFGITSRAAGNGNGLYRATASVPVEKLQDIKINVEPGLVQTLKDAVKNRTATDMVAMVKKVYAQLQDVCDANALRYTYQANTGAKDDQGLWILAPQKVYSNYGMAATAFKPLSFATLKGTSLRNMPIISPIEISQDMVDLELGTFQVNSGDFNLGLHFGQPVFGSLGEMTVSTTVHATLYDDEGHEVTGDIPVTIDITQQAEDIQYNFTSAINEWLNEGGETLDDRINNAIWYSLFNDPNSTDSTHPYDSTRPVGVVVDLTKQVNDMMGDIQNKLYDLVDQINNDYLGKVNTLISRYNSVANRINGVLSNPNHYLQSVVLYQQNGGGVGILSTNPSQPTIFKGNGEAISLWTTTYNFETVCPVFKKIVGVVKVTNSGVAKPELARNANQQMAFVTDAARNRVALDIRGAVTGDVYEVAYQALDYTGHTSTVKCYLQIVR